MIRLLIGYNIAQSLDEDCYLLMMMMLLVDIKFWSEIVDQIVRRGKNLQPIPTKT